MPLVNMKALLADAMEKNYAVGSFSVANIEMIQGVIKAAEETKSPIILQIAEENGWDFIYLGDLGERADMRADGLFGHSGVAHHPGDKGMEEIATRIWERMQHFL